MITRIRDSRWFKVAVLIMVFQILLPLIIPPEVHAITGGPSQPEFTTFTPVGVSDMVDPFTGDFSYNIPLMDVGGYPINLSYSSGITMEQQATCVGLGWTLNAGGAINRSMRGIPDDFNGTDKIVKRTNLKDNVTIGANMTWGDIEVTGQKLSLNAGVGVFHNNYTGIGFEANVDPSIIAADKNGNGLTFGIGLSANTKEGIGVSPKVGMRFQEEKTSNDDVKMFNNGSLTFGGYNSRAGIRSLAVEANFSKSQIATQKTDKSDSNPLQGWGAGAPSGFGFGASIPVGTNSYIPQIGQSMLTNSVSVDIGTGLETFWINGKLRVGGYFNSQRVKFPEKSSPAYGFFYADKGKNDIDAMHDFNREKDGAFTDNTPYLPLTQMTYDIYTVSGQGLSGMFRPHRDFATVYDPYTFSNSTGNSFGGDAGFFNLFKGGINYRNTSNYSQTGRWTSNSNKTRDKLSFNSREDGLDPVLYEPFYMKSAGEFATIDDDYFNKIQGFNPVRIEITKDGEALQNYKKLTNLSSMTESSTPVVSNIRAKRDRRNEPMTLLPANIANYGALERNLKSYPYNNPVTAPTDIVKTSRSGAEGRKGHHISEITVDRPDGARYVYGEQVYNFKQIEATFNTEGAVDTLNGFVGYNPNVDNTMDNSDGIDHYFSSTELPPYATAYQLTAVLSADYVDLTGDGPTLDDLGTYTKFNYTTIYNMDSPYKWRNPYNANIANFSEGYKVKDRDNKGNYLYGEKEIKMLHSIETKNYIAEFKYSTRRDAYDVAGENGGQGANTLRKLDEIALYTRCDREENLNNATPLKTVHFEYDYFLCRGIPSYSNAITTSNELNGQGGKLTLKRVYFTYEDSEKGRLSPYIFHYADADHNLTFDTATESTLNPNYNFRENDRWGCYKPNDTAFPNTDNPYVIQDKTQTDIHAAAWSLRTIQLPSGGLIKVDLESDDYAYVQDKRATRMFKVEGFSETLNTSGGYSSDLVSGLNKNHLYMYVSAPDVNSADEFRKHYIGEGNDEIKDLYYKFLIDITGSSDYEYIPGYAPIDNVGWSNGVGWIKIKPTSMRDNGNGANVHPITKTALQFIRIQLPDYVMGRNPENTIAPINLFYEIVGLVGDAITMIAGANRVMRDRGMGRTVNLNKSFIRLQTPNYKKLGGGVRVNQITIDDRWGSMSGNDAGDFDYGQTYDYDHY